MSCLLYVGVLAFKQIFGKQTIYNLGTDLTLTTPNFQQKYPLIICVIQVDTIGNWYALKCQWLLIANSPHYDSSDSFNLYGVFRIR